MDPFMITVQLKLFLNDISTTSAFFASFEVLARRMISKIIYGARNSQNVKPLSYLINDKHYLNHLN